ncbi:hypothetical protein [Roseovarius nubinhibens]|uniref:Colicin transporter n=1 Tax=Roseovarius nubinhibens TaxID=314263 RepID=A0A348WFB4_9RHOB|nr:hypothetical protein [Roseovarius nubinhibens]|tara:strand:+ start:5191 stop:5745 length:555 start_codon:yes stop_codon:yes gene_type:complete
MSDIDALQGRIMAALDRIGQGLDGLEQQGGTAGGDDELAQLKQALEDEKLVTAQLEERNKTLSQRLKELEAADSAASSERKAGEAARKDALRKLDAELQSLRLANQQLRDNNAALREANQTGVIEPHLINKSMMAELNGLRATRAADEAEMKTILTELEGALGAGAVAAVTDDASNGDARTEEA